MCPQMMRPPPKYLALARESAAGGGTAVTVRPRNHSGMQRRGARRVQTSSDALVGGAPMRRGADSMDDDDEAAGPSRDVLARRIEAAIGAMASTPSPTSPSDLGKWGCCRRPPRYVTLARLRVSIQQLATADAASPMAEQPAPIWPRTRTQDWWDIARCLVEAPRGTIVPKRRPSSDRDKRSPEGAAADTPPSASRATTESSSGSEHSSPPSGSSTSDSE